MTQLYSDSIFWVETEKINPNPYQPRKEFDERALTDLADSIRQYGVLQPLVVTRKEIHHEDGGMRVEYELIAGERRLRASKLAGLHQVPVIIRQGHEDAKMKLELAIIENLQREDLNPIDRAQAFLKLHEEFGFTHAEIGKKMGKSREYVSNSLRLLSLPEEIKQALVERRITEGHTRSLLMLSERPQEQATVFKEIMYKKMSVRETEQIARSIAKDKVRKKDASTDPKILSYQEKLSARLGTRVSIEPKEVGGKIVIDFFTPEDLEELVKTFSDGEIKSPHHFLERFVKQQEGVEQAPAQAPADTSVPTQALDVQPLALDTGEDILHASNLPEAYHPEITDGVVPEESVPLDDRSQQEIDASDNRSDDDDMYSVSKFSL